MFKYLLILLAFALLGAGCAAHVPMAPPLADSQAKAFQPQPDAAALYVVRPGNYFGSAIMFQVAVDGQVMGHLATKTYLLLPLAPGTHTVVASSNENSARETVTLHPGQFAFVALAPRMGMVSARVALQVLDADTGQRAVAKSRLAQRLDQ
jgi:hypothetical protein